MKTKRTKMTILKAAAMLESKGHTLVRGAEYDLVNMTARYRVVLSGETDERVLTAAEVFELI